MLPTVTGRSSILRRTWRSPYTDYDLGHVKEELADVMVYCRDMLDVLGLDEDEIINAKMDKNEKKYPVEKARGNATKYDSL